MDTAFPMNVKNNIWELRGGIDKKREGTVG
jgi:hypothetical protein